MNQAEWLNRYRQRLTNLDATATQAVQELLETVCFEELSWGYEEDPEGAADFEFAHWRLLGARTISLPSSAYSPKDDDVAAAT